MNAKQTAAFIASVTAKLGFDPRALSDLHAKYAIAPQPIPPEMQEVDLTDSDKRYLIRGLLGAATFTGTTLKIVDTAVRLGLLRPVYSEGAQWFRPEHLNEWMRARNGGDDCVAGYQGAAEYLGCQISQVHNLIKNARLVGHHQDGQKAAMFRKVDLDALRGHITVRSGIPVESDPVEA